MNSSIKSSSSFGDILRAKLEQSGSRSGQMFIHDVFNIIALMVVCFYVGLFLYRGSDPAILGALFDHYRTKGGQDLAKITHLVSAADEMELYYWIFNVVCSYLLLDMIWVLILPKCVPSSPTSIVVHHLATFVLLGTTYFFAPVDYAWNTAIYLTVELNTIILVSKRNLQMGSLLWKILDILFYVSWVVQRLIMFPVLTWWSYHEYLRFSVKVGTHINALVLTPVFTALLAVLSYKWTIDLLFKKQKKSKTS